MIDDCLDIVWRTADEKWLIAARQDIINSCDGVSLELRDGIDFLRLSYVQEVVRYERSLFRCDFSCADIEAPVDLARVRGDDFPMKSLCQCDTQGALTGRGWAEDDY